MSRWKNRPLGSNWGDFGEDDQIGRLNLITADAVKAAAAEVQEGLRFCLSLPLDLPGGNKLNPRRYPPVLQPTYRSGDRPNMNFALSQDDPKYVDVICDDAVLLHTQYSTQWDSLAHVGQQFDADGDGVVETVYYNGYRAVEHIRGPNDEGGLGALALGIENMAAASVQGRGVMINLEREYGRDRTLIGYDLLMAAMEKQKVVVASGDMVCLHTGFAEMLVEMKGNPDPKVLHGACAALDGRDSKLLQWITDSGLSVLIADNYAVEAFPATDIDSDSCAALPLHEHCLFKLGIHLGELWHLTPLADWLWEQGRNRFMPTAPPLRLTHAVGSPANPIATV